MRIKRIQLCTRVCCAYYALSCVRLQPQFGVALNINFGRGRGQLPHLLSVLLPLKLHFYHTSITEYTPLPSSTCGCKVWTHNCLDHPRPLMTEFVDGASNVHHLFPLHLFQDAVYGNERPCTAHSSTAGSDRSEAVMSSDALNTDQRKQEGVALAAQSLVIQCSVSLYLHRVIFPSICLYYPYMYHCTSGSP